MTRLLVTCRFAPYAETDRLRVRHGLEVAEADATWTESYGPDVWLASGRGAEVQLGHDTAKVGEVVSVAAHDRWWYADIVVESDDPEVIERLKVGTPLSLGARTLQREDDLDLHIRRHTRCQLQHIAIAARGQIGAFPGAQITGVVESRQKPRLASSRNDDWLVGLPPRWKQSLVNAKPGEVVALLGTGDRVEYSWNGRRFVTGTSRLAA